MPPAVEPFEPVQGAGGLGKVLLVRAAGSARAASVDQLVAAGLAVTPCDDARSALHVAAEWSPDALVVDPVDGVPDLFELRRLAHAERLANAPVLLHHGPPRVALLQPVADLIGGPVERGELSKTLRRLQPEGGGKLLALEADHGAPSVTVATARREGWSVLHDPTTVLREDTDLVVAELYGPHFLALDQLLDRLADPSLGQSRVILVVPRAHRVGDEARLKVWLSSDARPRLREGIHLAQKLRWELDREEGSPA